MDKKRIIISIITISLIVNLIFLTGIGIIMYKYNLFPDTSNIIGPNLAKQINTKVIEQNIEEYRTIHDLENDITKAVKKASPSVVSIIVTKDLKVFIQDPYNFFGGTITERKEKIGGGSGIIVSSDGYILTNKHVVSDPTADYSVVTKEGDSFRVDKIWLDPILDIAVLKVLDQNGKIPTNLDAATIESIQDEIKIGQFSIAIGNALAVFNNTATFGIISGKGRQLDQNQSNSLYIGLYQTDAPINPGNSGGPLLDMNGNVIGINTAITAIGQGIGFAIPINKEFVETTLNIINKDGAITRPFAGITYIELNKSIAKSLNLDKFEGIYVESIINDSPSTEAGILTGDIITEIDGEKIAKYNNFIYQLFTYKPGDTIKLLIYRGDKKKKIDLKLGSR